jgi:hypothetical protein
MHGREFKDSICTALTIELLSWIASFKGVAKRLQLLVMLLLQVGDQAWCELRPRCDALA